MAENCEFCWLAAFLISAIIFCFFLAGKDRVIFVTEEDHNGPSDVSLPEDDETPGKRSSAILIVNNRNMQLAS